MVAFTFGFLLSGGRLGGLALFFGCLLEGDLIFLLLDGLGGTFGFLFHASIARGAY
uniref:Predicted protein n=1 Tax=Hordeum vulgare subsp. vulgare TaxID=112509 RepID=F2DVW2_HORVV|nr:predicted protein [Hordeum vulgare subsp. vulgare]